MNEPSEGESSRPPTRAEQRAANQERHRLERERWLAEVAERKRAAASRAEPPKPAESRGGSESPPNVEASAVASPPPPVPPPECDPYAPDAVRQLFGAAYRRLWRMIHDPTLTNMDVIAAFSAARLAAGVGKEAPTPTKYALPMHSLLRPTDGESDGHDDVSPDPVKTSDSESTELGDGRPQTAQPTGGESTENSPRGGAIPPGSTQVPPDA